MSKTNKQLRLSKDFIPSHYEILLDLDIINLLYKSKTCIYIISQKDNPKYLSLNSKFISKEGKIYNYKLTSLSENDEDNFIIKKLDECPIDECVNTISAIYFELKQGIKKGQKLIFECEKNDEIKTTQEGYGLYICFWDYKLRKLLDKNKFDKNEYIKNFKDSKNPTPEEINQNINYFNSLVISLNSSPMGLRELIPCFDEPCFKSTFKLIISLNKNIANSSKYFTVVNNSDIDKITEESNNKIFYFKTTPKMSCYLLTFTIGFYEYSEKFINKSDGNKLRLRLYTPLNKLKDNINYLSLTEDALKRYEKMFDYPYPLDKLDSIFIPNLNFTAMEFFGCITYKQELLLDNNITNSFSYRMIIKDVYHENFHNWIGNLTTMEFFDNTWLNEGLTKFMENYILKESGKAYFDDIMRFSYFYTLTYKTHALNNKLLNDEESVRKNFDNITYEKGGYIMYMLVAFFGEDKVFKGLKLFFEKFKYNNANEQDFFDSMSHACDYDIKYLLNEWIYEPSHPFLNISFSENKEEIFLEQFPNFGRKGIIFKIPVFIKTKNFDKVILMKEKNMRLKLYDFNITYEDIKQKNNFIVFNSDIKCFCVVNYLDEILKDAIFAFYNNKEKRVSDSDIYQILLSYQLLIFNKFNYKNNFITDITKLKNIKNSEILYYIIYCLTLPKIYINKFFRNDVINERNNIIKYYNELIYGVIDYNNSDLINKILEKFDKINENREEDETGQIDYEKYFILIICIYKRDENIIKKIFEIFKNNEFNLYKIYREFRNILPLIINEFMYLFQEGDKIKVYESMYNYYEEMYYNLFFFDRQNFENSLNNLNKGFSFDILDYYFEKNDIDDIKSIDDIIIDYFFNYINKLNGKNNSESNFINYLYEIGVNQNFDINDDKLKKVFKVYSKFVCNSNIDKNKLVKYIGENYLHLKDVNNLNITRNLISCLKLA